MIATCGCSFCSTIILALACNLCPSFFVSSVQIFEAIAKISSAKATNARNDEKIQQILKLSATA